MSPRFPQPTRVYEINEPMPFRAEIHAFGCRCPACDPDAPLTAGDVGKLGLAGLFAGVTIAIALDPTHAARSVLAICGIGL